MAYVETLPASEYDGGTGRLVFEYFAVRLHFLATTIAVTTLELYLG